MQMLPVVTKRLNASAAEIRQELKSDEEQLQWCLSRNGAFRLKKRDLAYQLLTDMDALIFETRSLYEIIGKFLVALFESLFNRKMTESEVESIPSAKGIIDTRWIAELRENRKLLFHQTAPWIAMQIDEHADTLDPALLKKSVTQFNDPNDIVNFAVLRDIYRGFVQSATALHQFIMEQIRLHEEASAKPATCD
jgi:hypothetical protein